MESPTPTETPVILFRAGNVEEEKELDVAARYFRVSRTRTSIPSSLVVGRYSVLPYYKELAADLAEVNSRLINSYSQHRYVADLRNWVEDPYFAARTPQTWYRLEDVPQNEPGPFVLKGETNSRKHDWKTHMFAKDRADASTVMWRLDTDGLIGQGRQGVYIRKYVPFKKLLIGINDLPITLEFRFFIVFGKVLCGAFYWSNYVDDLPETPQVDSETAAFVAEVAAKLGDKIPFVVVDVAIDEQGRRWIVELNDGQFSGLSENKAETLYSALAAALQQGTR